MNNNINDFPSIVDDMRRPRDSVAGYAVCMGLCELNGATAMGYSGAVNFTLHSSGATAVELLLFDRGERPTVIIADPARKGCDRQSLEYMAKMQPDRIVMISCNHATAARDCAILAELGYDTVKVTGVDLFPRTTHVECVVLLTKSDI